jgi:dsRNA-specific ribonuclease
VKLNNVSATGEGLSRRAAEQSAAIKVLKQFNYAETDTISESNRDEQVKGS